MSATLNNPPTKVRWGKELYYQMGALGWFDGKRVELIEGDIYEMSPIGSRHAVAVTLVHRALDQVQPDIFFASCQNPLNSGQRSEPVPDVAVIRGKPRDYSSSLPKEAVLVVEVADSSLKLDQTIKARLYATANIQEYWILDLNNDLLIVHRSPNSLSTTAPYSEVVIVDRLATATPLYAPGSTIAVAELLP